MKILTTRLYSPVLRQDISASIHSQGKPTAFEKMSVFLVKTGQASEELRGQSLPALFELVIGSPVADLFLENTFDRLFSPAFSILSVRPDVRFSAYRDLPVSEIEILPNGEDLLVSGLFPTCPRDVRRSVVYDPLAGTVEDDGDGSMSERPDDPVRALPRSLATDTWPTITVEDFVRRTLLRPGDSLSSVSQAGTGRVGWTSFKANLELDGETLKASSSRPGAADYLNALIPEEFRRLMLSGMDSVKATGPVRSLAEVDPDALSPARKMPAAPESWIWLHPEGDDYVDVPKRVKLEVCWSTAGFGASDGSRFSIGADGGPDRLIVPSSPYPDETSSGDLRTFSHVVSVRAFFSRTPMVIPVGIRETLPAAAAAKVVKSIVSALRVSGHPRARAHARVLAREAGLPDLAPQREHVAGTNQVKEN